MAVSGNFKERTGQGNQMKRYDNSMRVGTAAIDFTDAFCRTNKATVVARFLEKGGDPRYGAVLWDFLTDRTMQVRVNGHLSKERTLKLGVPQGTILGPFCWLLFADTLIEKLREQQNRASACLGHNAPNTAKYTTGYAIDDDIKMHGLDFYADDGIAWFAAAELRQVYRMLHETCRIFSDWARDNDTPISPKSKIFVHRAKAPTGTHPEERDGLLDPARAPVFNCGGVRMKPETDEMRFLGVWFDSAMTGSAHVRKLMPELRRIWAEIMETYDYMSPFTLGELYKSEVLSRMLYASAIWYPDAEEQYKSQLRQFHCACVRAIIAAPQTANTDAVWQESGFLDFDTLVDAYAGPLAERIMTRRSDLKRRIEEEQPKPSAVGNAKVKGECRRRVMEHHLLTRIPRIPALAKHGLNADDDVRCELHEWRRDNIEFHLLSRAKTPQEKKQNNIKRLEHLLGGGGTSWLGMSDGSVHMKNCFNFYASSAYKIWTCDGDGIAPATNTDDSPIEGAEYLGKHHSSYNAEQYAFVYMLERVKNMLINTTPGETPDRVVLGTDSLSLLSRLNTGPIGKDGMTQRIWTCMQHIASLTRLHVTFLHSHCDFYLHEQVDKMAGNKMEESMQKTEKWRGALARQRPVARQCATRYHRASAIDQFRMSLTESKTLRNKYGPKTDAGKPVPRPASALFTSGILPKIRYNTSRVLTQLRVGVCPLVGGWRYDFDDPCTLCGTALRRTKKGPAGAAVVHVFRACMGSKTWTAARAKLAKDADAKQASPSLLWASGDIPVRCAIALIDARAKAREEAQQ